MSADCPYCGADMEWLSVVGDAANPDGSVWRCPICDVEVTDSRLAKLRQEGMAP